MHFSIIIPVLNEADTLPVLLRRLQAWRSPRCEIIVVDGGSVDGTAQRSAGLADRIVPAPPGRARQMNRGAAHARGEVLWFVHADTCPPADGPACIATAIGRRGWGRFNVRLNTSATLLKVVAWMMNWRSRLTGIATGDQALFVRRDWFDRVGGFPDIPLMEDIAMSRALKRLGRPACLRATVRTSARRWERGGVGRTILLMWRLRLAYFFGADPATLAARYRGG